ncbi:MAG: DUF1559 domain-containing protein [Thermogutta sp.]|uniref:DUF1559 domain-containing protein n=1 Tax=Thermogutta sp. TaxID=1962930 RepID=UPI0019A869E7|nr:DUF1559 domain-containing protein [Thermogutta sp.]MBC7352258.1 DUF1559 domain-containing protein [Thermogutta sp.]
MKRSSSQVGRKLLLVCLAAVVGGAVAAFLPRPSLAQQAQRQGELSEIPSSAVGVMVVHPRRILTAPESELMPIEVISAVCEKELGFDPVQLSQMTASIVLPQQEGAGPASEPPRVLLALRFSAPQDPEKLFAEARMNMEKEDLAGKPFYVEKYRQEWGIYMADPQSVLLGHPALIREVVKRTGDVPSGPVIQMLQEMQPLSDFVAVVHLEPLAQMVPEPMLQMMLPPPLSAASEIPPLVSSLRVQANFTGDSRCRVMIFAKDASAAEKLEHILEQLLRNAKQMMIERLENEAAMDQDDVVSPAMARYIARVGNRIIAEIMPQRKDNALAWEFSTEGRPGLALAGTMVGLLLPAVQSAREAARRAQSMNNLKQLALALHNYHDMHRHFPPQAITDKNGKPLLSWRVALLPYLECNTLYEQFHLDEPWDSPHNSALIEQMPEVFRNPSAPRIPGIAHYLGVVGKGAFFEEGKTRKFADIRDGTSNTIMLVEVDPDRGVIWTKPEDLPFNPDNPLDGLGHAHPGGFNAAFVDGSVRFISANVDPEVFRRLITIADGEVVDPDRY